MTKYIKKMENGNLKIEHNQNISNKLKQQTKHCRKLFLILFLFSLLITIGCQQQYYFADSGPPYPFKFPNYDAQIDSLKKEIKADSTKAESYILLGKNYAFKKQYEEACKYTEKAISIAPENLDSLKNDPFLNYWAIFIIASMKHVENKEFELAINRIERSLDFEPESSNSTNLLAKCYENLKKFDDAEKTYKRTIELNPEFIDAYINLAHFYKNKTMFEEALMVLRDAESIVENPNWLKAENEYIVEQRKKEKVMVHTELGKLLLLLEKTKEFSSDEVE